MKHILFISGSLRIASINTALLKALEAALPEGYTSAWADIQLPLFNEELESDFPAAAKTFRTQIQEADVVIIATPEYNRGMSGVLKNAIDWASRPYGENAWSGKRILVCSASPSGIGGALALYQVKQSLLHLDAHVIGQPEVMIGNASSKFDETGTLTDADTKTFISEVVAAL